MRRIEQEAKLSQKRAEDGIINENSNPDFGIKFAENRQKAKDAQTEDIKVREQSLLQDLNRRCTLEYNREIINNKGKINMQLKNPNTDNNSLMDTRCSNNTIEKDGKKFHCKRRKESEEEKKFRTETNKKRQNDGKKPISYAPVTIGPKGVNVGRKSGKPIRSNKAEMKCLANETLFHKDKGQLGGQRGGRMTDNLFLYKKNMGQNPYLYNVIELDKVIQGEEQIPNCIQLDNTEGKVNEKITSAFNSENKEDKIAILEQMFTGGKNKTRRRKRNKSNKNKKKKLKFKIKSRKNKRKTKIKHEKINNINNY